MATRGREFPNSKKAGRNASESMSSLVNEVEEPTLWTEGEGRWVGSDYAVKVDFVQEMRCFLPVRIITETVEHDSLWEFLADTISAECEWIRNILSGGAIAPVFKM